MRFTTPMSLLALSALFAIASVTLAQDGLGKPKGGGSSSGGSSQGGGGGSKPSGSPSGGAKPSGGGSQNGGAKPSNGGSQNGGGSTRDRDRASSNNGGGSSSQDPFGRRGGNSDKNFSQNPARGQNSRSGQVQYGTTSNVNDRVRVEQSTISRAPLSTSGRISDRVERTERVGLANNGFRHGYFHYDRGWRDDNFCYPHYVFSPVRNSFAYYSPWYYYISLPAYVNVTRIVVNPFRSEFYWSNWNNGWNFSYTNRSNTGWNNDWSWNDNLRGNDRLNDWDDNDLRDNQWRGNSRNDENLRDALQDLERAFERKDRRAMGRLIPRNGKVNIMLDGNFQYSLNADDFFDLFQDGISNVKTDRYEIVRVRQNRNSARVIAKHTFRDPWGRQQTNFQAFYLEGDRRDGYVIREFDTTNRL